MGNRILHNGLIAFHPGYYIEEIMDEMGLAQQDFAQSLGAAPKNISKLPGCRWLLVRAAL